MVPKQPPASPLSSLGGSIPAYVPAAARRYRSSSFVDINLLTPAESHAQQALTDMATRHAEERAGLKAALADAREAADPLRDGLLYGTVTAHVIDPLAARRAHMCARDVRRRHGERSAVVIKILLPSRP